MKQPPWMTDMTFAAAFLRAFSTLFPATAGNTGADLPHWTEYLRETRP